MIRLAVDEPPPADTQVAADCTVGLCYRVKEPFLVRSLVDGIPSSEIVYLPNKVPLIEIDVRRAILVQKIQKIDFDANGFLKSAYVKKDSELLAASKVPLAIMTAISSALPLRLTIQQKQVELAQKRVAEAQAKRQLMETRATGGVVKDAQ
mgnify:FL=1